MLELDEVVLAAIGDSSQFVELVAYVLAYHLSLAELDGRFRFDVMADALRDAVARVDLFADVLELWQIRFLTRLLDLLERAQGHTELDDFARVGTPHGHLANDALHIAQTAQSFIDRFGKVGVAEEVFHYVQALLDAFGMDEREEHPAVQQTAAHGRGGVVDDAEERTSALVHGTDQLQAAHSELVEAHIGLVVDAANGGDVARLSVLCGLQIAQDSSSRRGGKNHLLDAETLQVLRIEKVEQLAACILVAEIEVVELVAIGLAGEALLVGLLHALDIEHFLGRVVVDELIYIVVGAFGAEEFACRDVEQGDAAAVLVEAYGSEEVVFACIEHVVAHREAWSNEFGDAALYQFLGEFGVLELFAYSYTFTCPDESGQVGIECMIGESGQGIAGACGQRDAQYVVRLFGVVAERLVEVAYAVEDDCVGMFLFQLKILLEHRRIFGIGIYVFSHS